MSQLNTDPTVEPRGRAGDETGGAPSGSATRDTRGLFGWLPDSTLLRHTLLMLAAFIGIALLLESTDSFRNSQLAQMSYYAIAAAGLTLLTGLNGQISLGHGALMAVGGYTSALLLTGDDPLPFPVVALAAIAVTALVGAVVGVAAARLHGPYLAGATLALAVGLPSVALYFREALGGEQGLTVRTPRAPDWFEAVIEAVTGDRASGQKYIAYIGWVALLVTLLFLSNLVRSKVGREWRAVRDDEVAAELAGINLGSNRVVAFVVSAACAGLAGAVLAIVVRLAAPTAFTIVLSLSLLTAIVLGGLGSLVGAVLGAALLVFLPQITTDFATARGLDPTRAAETAFLVYGLVLILVMLLAPGGFVGTIRKKWLERQGRRAHAQQQAATG
jgi:branched-chain amino acid transport system permease protein